MSEHIIKVEPFGDGWRVGVEPPHPTWPDDYEVDEVRALARARSMRFATSWEIDGHPRKRSARR